MLSPSKNHQIFIEQQPDPSPNVTKSSDVLLNTGDDEIVQPISPVNKSGQQKYLAVLIY